MKNILCLVKSYRFDHNIPPSSESKPSLSRFRIESGTPFSLTTKREVALGPSSSLDDHQTKSQMWVIPIMRTRSNHCYQTEHVYTVLIYCWSTVYDAGPAINQNLRIVTCLLGV